MTRTTTGAALSALLGRTRYLLLDFDGPVCAAFAAVNTAELAEQLRHVLSCRDLPQHVATTADPMEVLAYAATSDPARARRVEAALTEAELATIGDARPTPGAHDVIEAARQTGRHLAIVSNNSEACVRAYLAAHHLNGHISTIAARTPASAGRLKPDPYLVRQALTDLSAEPKRAVLIGDSPSDVIAAHQAGIECIGYANKPGKHTRLAAQHAELIIESMPEVAQGLAPTS